LQPIDLAKCLPLMFPNSFARRWLAVLAIGGYWLALFTLTHLPIDPAGHAPSIPHLDKLLHGAAFGGLAVLACLAVAAFRPPTAVTLLVVVGVLAIYAAADELTQGFVRHRVPDAKDWIADMLGVVVGIVAFAAGRLLWRASEATFVTGPAAE
jgi:VanZ family protein